MRVSGARGRPDVGMGRGCAAVVRDPPVRRRAHCVEPNSLSLPSLIFQLLAPDMNFNFHQRLAWLVAHNQPRWVIEPFLDACPRRLLCEQCFQARAYLRFVDDPTEL